MSKKHEPGMAYDMSKLNKIFAFLSVGLLITTFWVFLDDYLRPWKAVQLEAMQIRNQKLQERVEEASKNIDQQKLEELEVQLAEGKKAQQTRQDEIARLEAEIKQIERDIKEETITNGRLNSQVAATTFKYEITNTAGKPEARELLKKLHDFKAAF